MRIPPARMRELDPEGRTFRNINTPEEYFGLRGAEVEGQGCEGPVAEKS